MTYANTHLFDCLSGDGLLDMHEGRAQMGYPKGIKCVAALTINHKINGSLKHFKCVCRLPKKTTVSSKDNFPWAYL